MSADARTIRSIAETLVVSGSTALSARPGALTLSLIALRPNLLTLMGRGGLRTLVARALFLVSHRFPALWGVRTIDDGTLVGLEDACATLSDSEFDEVRLLFLTEILLLLLEFLGPGMTRAVISESWPHAPLDDIDLSQARRS